jgi:hypothetical protein
MCRTTAPAEWATPDEPSIARTIVSVLPEMALTSTISSRAVSGSITTVKSSPDEIVTPPTRVEPDTTVVVVAEEFKAPLSVVCCERDEYFLVVIAGPYRRE